jgi:hypothetical protein
VGASARVCRCEGVGVGAGYGTCVCTCVCLRARVLGEDTRSAGGLKPLCVVIPSRCVHAFSQPVPAPPTPRSSCK